MPPLTRSSERVKVRNQPKKVKGRRGELSFEKSLNRLLNHVTRLRYWITICGYDFSRRAE